MGSLIKHRFKPQGGVFNWMSKGENKNNPMESLACSWLVNLHPLTYPPPEIRVKALSLVGGRLTSHNLCCFVLNFN